MEGNGKLLMLMHELHGDNKDLFVRVTLSKPRTFVLVMNKMSVVLKYIPTKLLKLYLYILEKDGFVWEHFVILLFVVNIAVKTSNHSNICVCNSTKIMGSDFNYSACVTSYQLLQSDYMLTPDLLPTPIGIHLTLMKKLLQHDDPCQLLGYIWINGQITLIIVHRYTEEIHHVLEKAKKDGEHNWWENLLGWSLTATGLLSLLFHPAVILLTLTSITYNYIIYKFLIHHKTNQTISTTQNIQVSA